MKRFLGKGVQNLARLLSVSEIQNTEPLGPDGELTLLGRMKSEVNMREIVYELFVTLMRQPEDMKPELTAGLLRVLRVMIYTEDPRGKMSDEAIDVNWNHFVANRPPEKDEPAHEILSWIQYKYASLGDSFDGPRGAGDLVLSLVSHEDQSVRIAAVRYGAPLLDGGNPNPNPNPNPNCEVWCLSPRRW